MKMKKTIVLIIAAMVLTTTGCTSGGKKPVESSTPVSANMNATGYPVLKEKKTYKIVVTKDPNSQNSFNDKQCVKDAEAFTNIHIDWMDIPLAAWNEQVNIMIAAGNLPDAFCGANVDIMQNIDMFVPLDDYISKYAPNVVEMFKGDPTIASSLTAPDGKKYSLPTQKANPSNRINNMIWMNGEWLTKLGKSVPKTTDEFVDVLRAFKTGDPNGNGKADEIPLLAWEGSDESDNLHSIIGAFGVVLPFNYVYSKKDSGKKVIFGGTEEGLFPALQWLNMLYKENLLDRELFTTDTAGVTAKAQSKDIIVGSVAWWIADSMDLRFSNYIVLDPLTGPNGDKLWTQGQGGDPLGACITGFTITKDCKEPEVLVRYYDAAMRDMKTIMEWQWGPEGAGLWKPVGQDGWTQTTEFIPAGTNLGLYKRTICGSIYSPNFLWSKYAEKEVADPRNANKRAAAQRILPFAVNVMPSALYDPEKVVARNLLFTDIDSYMKKFFATSVVNGITEKQWADHLDNCKKLKTDEYAAMWEEFYKSLK